MSDADGGLEDLFSFREAEVAEVVAEPVVKPKSRLAWVLRNALLVAIATTVTVAVLRAAKMHVSLLVLVAAFTGLRLIMLAVAQVAAPAKPKRRSGVGAGGMGETSDSLQVAVRRWEKTLSRAQADPDLYSRNVLPGLAELTDERLRLRHGITRASDPRRARELLGDPLWTALHDPGRRTPKPREIETYVDALERL